MRREQTSKRNKKPGRKKQRRNRRFWRHATASRYERIVEIARRFTKDLNDARDLAHAVIFRLLKYCPKPIRIINLDAYIYVSVRNEFLDSQRRQKEIDFSTLEEISAPETAVLDQNITRFLATCDLEALMQKTGTNDPNLLRTMILIGAGYDIPQIAQLLNEPVRRTRYRWYRYRGRLRDNL